MIKIMIVSTNSITHSQGSTFQDQISMLHYQYLLVMASAFTVLFSGCGETKKPIQCTKSIDVQNRKGQQVQINLDSKTLVLFLSSYDKKSIAIKESINKALSNNEMPFSEFQILFESPTGNVRYIESLTEELHRRMGAGSTRMRIINDEELDELFNDHINDRINPILSREIVVPNFGEPLPRKKSKPNIDIDTKQKHTLPIRIIAIFENEFVAAQAHQRENNLPPITDETIKILVEENDGYPLVNPTFLIDWPGEVYYLKSGSFTEDVTGHAFNPISNCFNVPIEMLKKGLSKSGDFNIERWMLLYPQKDQREEDYSISNLIE